MFFSDNVAEASDEHRSDERCRAEFLAFNGEDVDDSSFGLEVLRPKSEAGRLVCAVYGPEGLLTGSVAGQGG